MSTNQPYPPDPRYQDPTVVDYRARNADEGNNAYAQSQYENYVDPAGNQVETREEVFEDRNEARANMRYWITRVVYFILGVLEVILALRFIFRLLGANPYSGFVAFLYSLSHPFVVGFSGIFNDQNLGTASVFEISTIIAMLIYALIAWGLVSLGNVVFAPILSGHQSRTTMRRMR